MVIDRVVKVVHSPGQVPWILMLVTVDHLAGGTVQPGSLPSLCRGRTLWTVEGWMPSRHPIPRRSPPAIDLRAIIRRPVAAFAVG